MYSPMKADNLINCIISTCTVMHIMLRCPQCKLYILWGKVPQYTRHPCNQLLSQKVEDYCLGIYLAVQKVVWNNIDEYIIGSGKMVELVSDICLHRESFQYTLLLAVLCTLAVYVHVYIDNTSVSYLCVHVHVPFHGCGECTCACAISWVWWSHQSYKPVLLILVH